MNTSDSRRPGWRRESSAAGLAVTGEPRIGRVPTSAQSRQYAGAGEHVGGAAPRLVLPRAIVRLDEIRRDLGREHQWSRGAQGRAAHFADARPLRCDAASAHPPINDALRPSIDRPPISPPRSAAIGAVRRPRGACDQAWHAACFAATRLHSRCPPAPGVDEETRMKAHMRHGRRGAGEGLLPVDPARDGKGLLVALDWSDPQDAGHAKNPVGRPAGRRVQPRPGARRERAPARLRRPWRLRRAQAEGELTDRWTRP